MILSDRKNFYEKKWALAQFAPLAETHSAHIFQVERAGQIVVLKIFKTLGRIDESSSAAALTHFAGDAMVRLFAHDEGALLMEFVDGANLTSVTNGGHDDAATKIAAAVLAKLHKRPLPANRADFISLERYFRSLLEPTVRVAATERELFADAKRLAHSLIRDAREESVLHGDFHHENIRLSSQRGWLAIDPKGVFGERTYDAANLFFNPAGIAENEVRLVRMAKILAESLSLDRQRLISFAFVHGCLSAAWSIEDGQNPAPALRISGLLRTLL